MQTGPAFLWDLWLRAAGKPEMPDERMPSLDVLAETQWSPRFERLARNRLIMGAFRYGRMEGQSDFDNVGSAIARLEEYRRTGNLEHLVDSGNLCMVEFERGRHPKRHWAAADGTGLHTEKYRG